MNSIPLKLPKMTIAITIPPKMTTCQNISTQHIVLPVEEISSTQDKVSLSILFCVWALVFLGLVTCQRMLFKRESKKKNENANQINLSIPCAGDMAAASTSLLCSQMEQTRSSQYTILAYVMPPSPESPNCCPFWVLTRDKLTYKSSHLINPRGKDSE